MSEGEALLRALVTALDVPEISSHDLTDEVCIALGDAKVWLARPETPTVVCESAEYPWRGRPEGAPPRYNGGTLCDMDVGPCACGAWHYEGEYP